MNTPELTEFADGFVASMHAILGVKGPSYSGATDPTADRLGNFKRCAKAAGVTPMQAWLIYFQKHVDAVSTYVRTGLQSEPIMGRFLDLANYALLGAALVEEHEGTVCAISQKR